MIASRTKAKRKAREWWVHRDKYAFIIGCVSQGKVNRCKMRGRFRVREVLPRRAARRGRKCKTTKS